MYNEHDNFLKVAPRRPWNFGLVVYCLITRGMDHSLFKKKKITGKLCASDILMA
jgi:hypothetical protein